MTNDELRTVFVQVEALWRNQSFKPQERDAWVRTLAIYEFGAVSAVLDAFALGGQRFIPDLPAVHEALRSHSRRSAPQWPAPPDEPEAKWADASQHLAECRKRLVPS